MPTGQPFQVNHQAIPLMSSRFVDEKNFVRTNCFDLNKIKVGVEKLQGMKCLWPKAGLSDPRHRIEETAGGQA
jgi:hypothetical protein